MLEFIQCGELKAQAKRLLRYRAMLLLLIVANTVMVLRVPVASPNRALAHAESSATASATNAVAAGTERPLTITPSQPPREDSPGVVWSSPEASAAIVEAYADARRWLTSLTQRGRTAMAWPAEGNSTPSTSQSANDAIVYSPTVEPIWQPWQEFRYTHLWPRPITGQPDHPPTSPAPVLDETGIPSPAAEVTDIRMSSDSSQHAARLPVPNGQDSTVEVTLPSAVVRTDPDRPARTVPLDLELQNPDSNRGAIRFLLNHRDLELRPGESHRFPAADQWLIQFHRGADFENVQRTLLPGTYQFRVTNRGWDLAPANEMTMRDSATTSWTAEERSTQ